MLSSISEVSFFTNCYEADWQIVLNTPRLQEMIEGCHYPFAFRGLIINNVNDGVAVKAAAEVAVNKGIIDGYFFSEDLAKEMLEFYQISRISFKLEWGDGYYYSLGPLAAIYKCATPFLVYFTCDCLLNQPASAAWISEGINIFEKDNSVAVAMPKWDYSFPGVVLHPFSGLKNWSTALGFTDQVFMIQTARFKKPVYNLFHPSCDHYPPYAGNLFERRVNGFLATNSLIRIIYTATTFRHDKLIGTNVEISNVSKKAIKEFVGLWTRRVMRRIRWLAWKMGLM